MRKLMYKWIVWIGVLLIAFPVLGIPTPTTKRVIINGQEVDPPYPFLVEGDEILIPLKWFATEMGASCVGWNPKTRETCVVVDDFLLMHQYLSYLNGLESYKKDEDPIPEAIQKIELPAYPLINKNPPMLHQKPIELKIVSHGSSMPWAVYDYTLKYTKLYVGIDWLNTLFLAQVTQTPEEIVITYPTTAELKQHISELEKIAMPTSAEEALNLWIRGQEYRSGGLQYIVLSPGLKEATLASIYAGDSWWVTGGSSPSFRNPKITNLLSPDQETKRFQIEFDEIAGGEILKHSTQMVTIKKYNIENNTYWLIDEVTGDTEYYTVLPPKATIKGAGL